MRIMLSLSAAVAALALALPPAHADDSGLLVGTWEMNTTMNGYIERGVMVLRANGTGRHDRSAFGQPSTSASFKWSMMGGGNGIRFLYGRNEATYVRIRFERTDTVILTPANKSLYPIGPDLEYERERVPGPIPKASRENSIGVWEAVVNADNGQSCRNELVLRVYGTGSDTMICGQQRQEAAIEWEFENGAVVKKNSNGSYARGRVRFLDKTSMVITPIDFRGAQNGPEVFYKKTAENDEGC